MSEREHPHNGRDLDGRFRVKQADLEDALADPAGAEYVRADIRHSGAVADTGLGAGARGEHIEDLIKSNREDVDRAVGRTKPVRAAQRPNPGRRRQG